MQRSCDLDQEYRRGRGNIKMRTQKLRCASRVDILSLNICAGKITGLIYGGYYYFDFGVVFALLILGPVLRDDGGREMGLLFLRILQYRVPLRAQRDVFGSTR